MDQGATLDYEKMYLTGEYAYLVSYIERDQKYHDDVRCYLDEKQCSDYETPWERFVTGFGCVFSLECPGVKNGD